MDEVIHETGLLHEFQGHRSLPDKEKYSASSSSENEKARMSADVEVASVEQAESDEAFNPHTINTDDPFPIDPHSPVEERQFTLRAVLVGCALGGVISASNVYLGLKVRPSYAILLDVTNAIRPAGPLARASLGPSLASPFSNPSRPPPRATSAADTLVQKKTTLSNAPRAPPGRSGSSSPPASPPPTNSVSSAPTLAKTLGVSSPLRSAVPFSDSHSRFRSESFTFSNSSSSFHRVWRRRIRFGHCT